MLPQDRPTTLIDLDFGDTELTVKVYKDGAYLVEMPESEGRLILNEEQFKQVVGEMDRVGKEKGWL